MGAAQLSDDFRIGEPFRDLEPFAQAAPELGAGQAQNLHVPCDLVLRNELRFLLDVDHLLKRYDRDLNFALIFLEQMLGGIGFVKWLRVGANPWSGMIATDDQMCAAVVLADDGVPHSFPG